MFQVLIKVMLNCHYVWRVWTRLVNWWNQVWVASGDVHMLFDWWWGIRCERSLKKLWDAIPLATLWVLWKARNDCYFKRSQVNWEDLVEVIKVEVVLCSSTTLLTLTFLWMILFIGFMQLEAEFNFDGLRAL